MSSDDRETHFKPLNQKNPRVHKICVRNSGAKNGCANFMDTWKNCVLSAGKPMSIKFLALGGGYFGFLGGGGDFIFTGARIFLIEIRATKLSKQRRAHDVKKGLCSGVLDKG